MSENNAQKDAVGVVTPPVSLNQICAEERKLIGKARVIDKVANAKDDGSYPVGLAFSGGGIRSATFNLGLAQALARLGLLRRFDYLSCVSGGNYVGTWLSSLIHRAEKASPNDSNLVNVEKLLGSVNLLNSSHGTPEPCEVTFLRGYSNYLAPKTGGFSLDLWTAISTYLRNLVLNQSLVFLVLAILMLVPQIAGWFFSQPPGSKPAYFAGSPLNFTWSTGWVVLAVAVLLLMFAVVSIARNLQTVDHVDTTRALPFTRQSGVVWRVIVPGFLASILVSWTLYVHSLEFPNHEPDKWRWVLAGVLFYGILCWGVAILASRKVSNATRGSRVKVLLAALASGALLGALHYAIFNAIRDMATMHAARGAYLAAVAGPGMLLLVAFSLTITLHIGLAKRAFKEPEREWWSRLGAWSLLLGLAWIVLFAMVWVGPAFVHWGEATLAAMGVGWAVTTVAGLIFGHSGATGKERSGGPKEWIAKMAPAVFILGALVLVACVLHLSLTKVHDQPPLMENIESCKPEVKSGSGGARVSFAQEGTAEAKGAVRVTLEDVKDKPQAVGMLCFIDREAASMSAIPLHLLLGALVICAILLGVLSWRIDVNLFSFHQFYRNRLTRCYLGATRRPGERTGHPFTDIDPNDDLPISQLAARDQDGAPISVQRPLHIANTALNMSGGGSHLAWQQRQACSFPFTPLYSGFEFPPSCESARSGWVKSDVYMSEKQGGPHMGSLMAVSGAAASPNMGYHTNPQVAFLLALFNIRLGRWCPNPARPHSDAIKYESPILGIRYLLKELFADVDEDSNFVYLSDGGHFENLGVYELVRRRCALIVAGDGSADKNYGFEDLANAIRKCRIDLGVEIEIDISPFQRKKDERNCPNHFAVGTIRYPAAGGLPTSEGKLIYIKASLSSHTPTDVQEYAGAHTDFPHESTGDQFFDESQFESYRKLGLHIGLSVFGDLAKSTALKSQDIWNPCDWVRLVESVVTQPKSSVSA